MKKKLFFFSTIILTLAGCTSEDFVGDKELQWQNENGKAISLNLVAAPQTRAVGGSDAAGLLNNNFVIYGMKSFTSGTPATQVVFNNYQANYVTGSNNTTTSNSAGWEYVGYKNLPYGTTTSSGGTLNNDGVATNATASGIEQTIKYWDYSANKYEFFGYSLGKGDEETTPTYATATALTPYTYTLTGTQAQLAGCYISDLLTKTDMNATNTVVQLQFRKMESKVRIALYETIPGYSVKDVKFYQSASATSGTTTAYLYDKGTTASLPKNGQYVVTYTAVENPTGAVQTPATTITWTPASTDGSTANVSFDVAGSKVAGNKWSHWAHRDYKEVSDAEVQADANVDTLFIGRTSNEATISEAQSVLPNPSGTELTLKVDYTLVSRDGYGETIEVKGATATVPAAYAQWQPNYSYTYLFKISDETNGAIGAITGLHPITLDAVVNTNAEGTQETITTVSAPSITTYQKGSNVTGMDEYSAGNIYVIVGNGSSSYDLTVGTNANLYIATVEEGAVQGITESTVANAIENGTHSGSAWTVTDANDKDLVVTLVATNATDKLTRITSISATDAPNGKEITGIYGASFAATAGTSTKYYVFEYIYTDTSVSPSETKKIYKVIKVASGS